MKVLITQHYFRSSEASFPEAIQEVFVELRDGRPAPPPNDEGFHQEIFECDLLIEAVAYHAGLGAEDFEGAPPHSPDDQTWIENEFGIFVSSETDASSYIIIDHSPTSTNTKH